MKFSALQRSWCALACLLIGLGANAQDTIPKDSSYLLEAVVVIYQAEPSSPVTFQNIAAEEIDKRSVGQEPSFILAETPAITAYSDAGNTQGYSYFRMRGIDQTRINMSLDGVPLNEPEDQGAYFSNYPDLLNSVSRLQIQRGVGTTKNGVANYAGSVQLYSPNLYDSTQAAVGFGYGSFQSLRAFAEANTTFKDKYGLYVRGSEVYSNGYKFSSANHSQSMFLSGGRRGKKSILKLNLLAGHQQNELAWLGVADSLIAVEPRTNANADEDDEFLQCLGQLQHQTQLNNASALHSSVYYTFLNGNYDFNLNNFLGLPSTQEMYNYAFRSHLAGFFSNYTYTKLRFSWTSGVHGNRYQRRHIGSERTFGQLYQNTGYKNEFSGFTKLNYTLDRFFAYADVQYRYTDFNYAGSVELDKINWQFINPKAGISYTIKPAGVVYYSIGSTGREPTRNDLFGGSDDLLADSLGNALLFIQTPERVVDHELGIRWAKTRTRVHFNLYYMGFQNEIVLNGKFGPNGLALTDDVDRSYRTGAELNLQFWIGNFGFINNSSFNYSRIQEQGVAFSPILTPPVIVNQEVVYRTRRFSVAVSGRFQSAAWMDFANTSKLEPYFLLNARAQYTLNHLQFSVFGNNLTDAQYFNHGYVDWDGSRKYFVQSPINFYGAVRYNF
jgi:iron complex outermembrane recepter protein